MDIVKLTLVHADVKAVDVDIADGTDGANVLDNMTLEVK